MNGIQEVGGSTPPGSTTTTLLRRPSPSDRGNNCEHDNLKQRLVGIIYAPPGGALDTKAVIDHVVITGNFNGVDFSTIETTGKTVASISNIPSATIIIPGYMQM